MPGVVQTEDPEDWEIGTYGGTWRGTYTEDPKSYNPFSNQDGTHTLVNNLTLDYLFDYDTETQQWEGNLIEDFSIDVYPDQDKLDLNCKLRNGVYWSDGVQMTADDVVWWYKNIDADPEISPVGYQGQFIRMEDGSKKRITIEKTGPLSFRFHFPRIVNEPVLNINTGDIVPRHIWEPVVKQGPKAARQFWGIETPPQELVGNGPFLLEKNVPGERLIFRRNPNYWMKDEEGNTLPYLDRIILTQVPDSNAEILKFQNGEIDSYNLRGQDFATLQPKAAAGEGYSLWYGGLSTGYPSLIFNQNNEALPPEKFTWFSDLRFRRAVSSLIDRKTIINQTINGMAAPLYHFVAEYNRYYNPERATKYHYDPERADELLNEAGFIDRNEDGIREDQEGNDISFSIMTHSQDPILHDYLNIIISDMQNAGINANLEVVDFNVIVDKIMFNFDWDCWLASFSFPTFPEQWYNIWRSDGNLHYWYPKQESPAHEWEKQMDELYESLVYTFDDKTVTDLYDDFQKLVMENLLIAPIFRKYSFAAFTDKWGNINWDTMHSTGDGYRRLYLKEENAESPETVGGTDESEG
ncbi:MAG: ABC transporter substrate-binding protein, partial [Spirochaetales bacterium]|nr:ABC transporter substrate-binding protein [Spirochaetales bacterium]MCF7938430.1 ABC transporter substrate-binding protein [Spirochaetales bacterium]